MVNWEKRKSVVFYVIWSIFIVLNIIQHQMIFIQHDDFAYGSLSYGYAGNHSGMHWVAKDLLEFLQWHYNNWGGRVLFLGIESIILRNGEWLIKLIQPFIIVGIIAELYLLISPKKKDIESLLICIILWMSIGVMTFIDGVYWYTASAIYVWPFLFLFGALLLKDKQELWAKILIFISLFLAGFSQEQIAILVIIYAVFIIIHKLLCNKGLNLWYVGGVIGGIICIFAPGNFCRSDQNVSFNELSLVQKILLNVPKILYVNLNITNVARLCVYSSVLLLLICCYEKRYVKAINVIAIVILFGVSVLKQSSYLVFCDLIFLIVFIVEILAYLINDRKTWYVGIFLGAIFSQMMLVFAPQITYRMTLPFVIAVMPILGVIMVENISRIKIGIIKTLLIMICLFNSSITLVGYGLNYRINSSNHKKLGVYKENLVDENKYIELERLRVDLFSETMPYMDGGELINQWIHNYYEIPEDVEFIWK